MIRRSLSVLVLAASTLAPIAAFALPASDIASVPAPPKGKMVKLTLKNSTDSPMTVLIEDQPVTIAAKGQYALRAPEGTRVLGENKAVKVVVTRDLEGSTCSFAN